MYHEARGESREGIIAVGHVVLNRVRSNKFPDTICGVVTQPKQFSGFRFRKTISDVFYTIADDLLLSRLQDNTDGSLFFHNESNKPFERKRTVKIGNHQFYR